MNSTRAHARVTEPDNASLIRAESKGAMIAERASHSRMQNLIDSSPRMTAQCRGITDAFGPIADDRGLETETGVTSYQTRLKNTPIQPKFPLAVPVSSAVVQCYPGWPQEGMRIGGIDLQYVDKNPSVYYEDAKTTINKRTHVSIHDAMLDAPIPMEAWNKEFDITVLGNTRNKSGKAHSAGRKLEEIRYYNRSKQWTPSDSESEPISTQITALHEGFLEWYDADVRTGQAKAKGTEGLETSTSSSEKPKRKRKKRKRRKEEVTFESVESSKEELKEEPTREEPVVKTKKQSGKKTKKPKKEGSTTEIPTTDD